MFIFKNAINYSLLSHGVQLTVLPIYQEPITQKNNNKKQNKNKQ